MLRDLLFLLYLLPNPSLSTFIPQLSLSLCLAFVYDSMIPTTYRYSASSPMPLDLNEDHTHQFFNTNHQASYSVLFNPDEDQGGSYYWGPKQLQSDEEAEKINVPPSGSRDHPAVEKYGISSDLQLRIWKKEDGNNESIQGEDNSVKWIMPSKLRILRRMMVSDQTNISEDKQKLPLSTVDHSSSNNNSSNNITVRVCADCHTTKTPLWRSGPTGPKSLCNACGIRQRKARRALAAAAESANGTTLVAAHVKENKLQSKGKKRLKNECAPQLQKKRKLGRKTNNKFSFEDLRISLSKNLPLQQVFPQDEKEAAILLMALSYGLLHGFPSDRYLDL